MGMSLRIGMWSPISLTLKPRIGITLIAASRDFLNPQLSLWSFSSLTTIRVIKITIYSTSIGPLKWICSSDSSEIHLNYHFMYISVTGLDHSGFWHCALSWKCFFALPKGNLRDWVSFVPFSYWADILRSVSRGLILSKPPPLWLWIEKSQTFHWYRLIWLSYIHTFHTTSDVCFVC